MARKGNIYLGKTVPDTGKPGLDNLREVKGIANNIVKDYLKGKISKRTATSRLNLLKLITKKDSDFKGSKLSRAWSIIEKARKKLKKGRKRGRRGRKRRKK